MRTALLKGKGSPWLLRRRVFSPCSYGVTRASGSLHPAPSNSSSSSRKEPQEGGVKAYPSLGPLLAPGARSISFAASSYTVAAAKELTRAELISEEVILYPFRNKVRASSSGQVAYHKLFSVRSYASAQAINVKELDCSPELKNLHERFTSEVQGKRTVPLALLRNIFEQCHSSEDVNLAFRTLQDYRIYRSSKARVKQNFNNNISSLAVSASLRSGSYGLGLKTLWKHNVFGLSPTIENAHMLLSHARKEKDMDLMKKILRTMVKNLVIPTTQTADIVIRTCKDNGDLNLMFGLANEFLQNGILLNSAVFDILIATAANFGSVEKVFEAQKFRKDAGLDHTIASAFAIAKAHILQGEPQIGADLIGEHCNDKAKINKYLAMLVTVWPSELLSRKEQAQIEVDDRFTEQLKDNVLLFAKALSKKFRGVSIDAEQEFGKGAPNPNKGAD